MHGVCDIGSMTFVMIWIAVLLVAIFQSKNEAIENIDADLKQKEKDDNF